MAAAIAAYQAEQDAEAAVRRREAAEQKTAHEVAAAARREKVRRDHEAQVARRLEEELQARREEAQAAKLAASQAVASNAGEREHAEVVLSRRGGRIGIAVLSSA